MKDRIKSLRKNLGLTQTDLGNSLGVSKSAISQLELGKISLTEGNIKLICSEYGVNQKWLRTGEGDMFAPVDTDGKLLKVFGSSFMKMSPLAKEFWLSYFDNPQLQDKFEEILINTFERYQENKKEEE